ncbi:MAG: transposase [Saprospiraceae bacterium]|nr:transposase [Saprospiraceae bacterium]MCF8251791.1 transposase [Saprospiraceae bacterium]MCF8313433.1 transposase [Saprospiraceae bacterium]MCF8442146.1 transposase [Saprospiraceae bacterium]
MKDFFYRGNLPHWQPPEGTFFITYRLYGSIPKPVIEVLKAEYQSALRRLDTEHAISLATFKGELTQDVKATLNAVLEKKQYEEQKRNFKKFDDFLDSRILNEPHWLKAADIAQFEMENIRHYAERYFDLYAVCIMSNHVHLLMKPNPDAPILWKVLQDMKKYSGRKINQMLGRHGKFWEDESYDHLVRDGEFDRILWYILNNPVKAGLVETWERYPFTFCQPGLVAPNPSSAFGL